MCLKTPQLGVEIQEQGGPGTEKQARKEKAVCQAADCPLGSVLWMRFCFLPPCTARAAGLGMIFSLSCALGFRCLTSSLVLPLCWGSFLGLHVQRAAFLPCGGLSLRLHGRESVIAALLAVPQLLMF